MADILYFASLAEDLGIRSEAFELPANCATASDLVEILRARGEPFAGVFDGSTRILVAINQVMREPDATVNQHDEIAFFPPITGG